MLANSSKGGSDPGGPIGPLEASAPTGRSMTPIARLAVSNAFRHACPTNKGDPRCSGGRNQLWGASGYAPMRVTFPPQLGHMP
jgi:hypothetical protein